MERRFDEMASRVDKLEVKSGIWGALGGIVVAVAAAVWWILGKK